MVEGRARVVKDIAREDRQGRAGLVRNAKLIAPAVSVFLACGPAGEPDGFEGARRRVLVDFGAKVLEVLLGALNLEPPRFAHDLSIRVGQPARGY
jgi:hypothetical protein